MKRFLLFSLVFLLPIPTCFPQSIWFDRLSPEEGFPSGVVPTWMQDRQGYLWFGTKNGLIRHDGYTFRTYENNHADSLSFSGSDIRTICEDRSGMLWIGTDGSGLNRFDRRTGHFHRYQHNPSNPNSLSHDDVYAVLEDREGLLWVATWGGGLDCYDPRLDGFQHYRHSTQQPHSLSNDYVRTIFQDRAGFIWVGTSYGGLNRFDPRTKQFTAYRLHVEERTDLADKPVWAICEDNAGYLWVGTDGGGLYRFHPQNQQLRLFCHNPAKSNGLPNNSVTSMYKDEAGLLWLGTWGGGLCRFNPETALFENFRHSPTNTHTLSSDVIWSLGKDRSGVMWAGTDGSGVCKFNPAKKPFALFTYDPENSRASLSHSVIRAIHEDRQGLVWIGTAGGGLNVLDLKSRKVAVYLPDEQETPMLTHMNVISICEDRYGMLWFGNFRGGLSCYNLKTGKAQRYMHDSTNTRSLGDNRIMALHEDRNGTLWIGTYEQGLNRFDRKRNEFIRYQHNPNNSRSLSSNEVRSIYEDRAGNLWIGTLSGGLNRFDPVSGTFHHYRHLSGNPNSLSSDAIRCMYEDTKGTLWIGTNNRGMDGFNPKTQQFIHLTKKEGLPDETILGILGDDRGNLWMSTNKGLCRYNASAGTFKTYDVTAGLQGNEFGIGAYHRGRSGRFYFGGFGGLNTFFPDSIQDNSYVPPVVVTEFRIFDKPQTVNSDSSPVNLSYRENFLSFEFAALNFLRPDRNQYAYQLEGVDKDWIFSGYRRYVSYTNLDPGAYVFRVKAVSSDGVWNNTGATIQLLIKPPFWRTFWFQSLAATSLIIIGYLVYKARVNAIQVQNRRLAALVAQRTTELETSLTEAEQRRREAHQQRQVAMEANRVKSELMGITAHDLKNPLGGIMLYTQLIKESIATPSEVVKFAEVIHTTSQAMYNLIANLLQTARAETQQLQLKLEIIDLGILAERVVSRNQAYANSKRQSIQLDRDEDCWVKADEDMMNEIFENLLSNALKYSPIGNKVWVTLRKDGDWLRFEVRDEGLGLGKQDLKKLFRSFQRLSAQPTGNEAASGLGLFIVKKLVELHDGKVWAKSPGKNKGSIFTIEIPRYKLSIV